jgi:hypothetical protein
LEFGTWNLKFRVWSFLFGFRFSDFGFWDFLFGIKLSIFEHLGSYQIHRSSIDHNYVVQSE